MTITLIFIALILMTRVLLEACSEKPKPGHDFLALMNAGVLLVSKKAEARTLSKKGRRR